MFTAFMLALGFTTAANVLVTMVVAPLFTAVAAWALLRHRPPGMHLWCRCAGGRGGIAWVYGSQMQGGDARHPLAALFGSDAV